MRFKPTLGSDAFKDMLPRRLANVEYAKFNRARAFYRKAPAYKRTIGGAKGIRT